MEVKINFFEEIILEGIVEFSLVYLDFKSNLVWCIFSL